MIENDEVLIKSRFVQVVEGGGNAIIWHSLFGNPKRVSVDTLDLLNIFSSPLSLNDFLNEYDIGENGIEVINDLAEAHYIIPNGFDERAHLETITQEHEKVISASQLARRLDLKLTEECNFRCKYCIHFKSLDISDRINNPEKFMSWEIAKHAVDEYVLLMKHLDKKVSRITFSGGEVLLTWDILERVVLYYKERYEFDYPCSYAIITNASLITVEIAKKLKEYQISVASSIDGLEQVNDLVRITKSGSGTFNRIVCGLDNLKDQGVPVDMCITVTDDNFPYIDERMVDWAVERGMDHLRFTPDTINLFNIPVQELVIWLLKLRAYGKTKGVDVTGGWHRPFSNFNDSALDKLCGYCTPICGDTISVSPAGLIYGCCYNTNSIGSIKQIGCLGNEKKYREMICDNVVGRRRECFDCEIEGQCIGGCSITRESSTDASNPKVTQMCELHRQMTRELLLEELTNWNSDIFK